MEPTEYGMAPASEGWFAVNVRDAAWARNEAFGDACLFEGAAAPFPQVGYTLGVLEPGQAVRIQPGIRHRFAAEIDTTLFEVSTPQLDDVVRLEDKYGRTSSDT